MSSAAAERESRSLELATDSLLVRLSDIQTAISGLIAKIETDPHLNWHSFLDSYALISGQLNSVMKTIKNERTPLLKKYITMPIILSPDRDEELVKITNERVTTFAHDIVPHYLRTKPDPEVESKHAAYEGKVSNTTQENLNKIMQIFEKVTQSTLKKINTEREDMESRSGARNEIERTTSHEETMELMSAITYGFNLRPMAKTVPIQQSQSNPDMSGQRGMAPKMTSSIKTNIKAASQVHPYQRN